MSGENYINHVVLVLDASTSMRHRAKELIRVADSQISYLARRSQELDQETRVSIYEFSDRVNCLVYDKDVLRLPSIANLYHPNGMTALRDATMKSIDDLTKTPELYGDHAFLIFVLTDGEENRSKATARDLKATLDRLPDHWTVGVLVPDMMGKHNAQSYGFPPANIAIWDVDNLRGVEEAGQVIRQATDNFMTARTRGVHGTKALFSTGADVVNVQTVRSALDPVHPGLYTVLPVPHDAYIKPFIDSIPKMRFVQGNCYYQLGSTKVAIQPQKQIYIRERKTGTFYTGPAARDLLGLPNYEVKVPGDYNPDYDVFVQSTSTNRKLLKGTDVLVLK